MSARQPSTLASAASAARTLTRGGELWLLVDADGSSELYAGSEAEVRRDLEAWCGEPLPTSWTLRRVTVAA